MARINLLSTRLLSNICLQFGRIASLFAGPILFWLFHSEDFFYQLSPQGHSMLGVALWMAVWWLTEVISIAATALLPVLLFPLFCDLNISKATSAYAHPYVFLFLGGFLLAIAIEKWSLHKRLALHIILLVGTDLKRVILGFMIATGFLSMWISNTAATVMLLPIALAVIQHQQEHNKESKFGRILMLAIAYAASIGGMSTLIGTPPNLVMAGIVRQSYGVDLSFFEWFSFAFPLSVLLLIAAWMYLTQSKNGLNKQRLGQGSAEIRKQLEALGTMSRQEYAVAIVFMFMALAWTFRSFVLVHIIPELDDTLIAIAGGLILFILPGEGKARLLDWRDTKSLPWGILLLFGGGMALADGFEASGLAKWIGTQLVVAQGFPVIIILIVLIAGVNFLTEITSNLATTAMLLPIVVSMASTVGIHPYLLLFGATLAASCAFMLPVATPPNALVFASGLISMKDMVRNGLWFNLISIAILTLFCYFVLPLLFDLSLSMH